MDHKEYFKKHKVELSDKQIIAIKLGGLITSARIHSKLSQSELAKKIGTQQPSLARAEKGEVTPSVEFLYKIAKALKTEFVFPKFGFMEERPIQSFYFTVNPNGEVVESTSSGSLPHAPVSLEDGSRIVPSYVSETLSIIKN